MTDIEVDRVIVNYRMDFQWVAQDSVTIRLIRLNSIGYLVNWLYRHSSRDRRRKERLVSICHNKLFGDQLHSELLNLYRQWSKETKHNKVVINTKRRINKSLTVDTNPYAPFQSQTYSMER